MLEKNKRKNERRRCLRYCSMMDLYAKPFNFTYNGSKNLSSDFGKLTTIIMVCLMLSFGIFQSIKLFKKTQYTST